MIDINIAEVNVNDTSNILKVKIPKELRVRHKSTIEWINEAFAGGFIGSQVVMLTGDPGAGKTTMCLQLADSLRAAGHEVLFNGREESIAQVALKCEQLGLQHGFTPSQHRRAPELLAQAERMRVAAKKKKRHMFLFQDSLPSLDDGKYKDGAINSKTPERAVKMLADWAKLTFATVIFINQVNKDGTFVGRNTVKHAIDAHARVKVDKKTGYRTFLVEKNRMGATYDHYIVTLTSEGLQLVEKIAVASAEAPPKTDGDENVIDIGTRRRRGSRRVNVRL